MTFMQTKHVHAMYLRACARALQTGDKEAREEALRLMAQADKLDAPQRQSEEVAA